MGCVNVCNIIPLYSKEWVIREIEYCWIIFFHYCNFFVNTSCWNQHNTWYINLNCRVDNLASCCIGVHCLNFELCVYLLIMCAFEQDFSPKDKCACTFPFQKPSVAYIRKRATAETTFSQWQPSKQWKIKAPPSIRNILLVHWLKLGIKCTNFVMGANSEPGNVILLCQLMENVAKFLKENVRIQMQKLSSKV